MGAPMLFQVLEAGSGRDDERRFEELVREYGELLRSAIARFCPRDAGISFSDIEQEARLRVWRALRSEREIRNLPSYLYRIAATATIDAVRAAKARREEQLRLEEDDEGNEPTRLPASGAASPEEETARKEGIAIIRKAVATLPDPRRRAVGLFLQGFPPGEVARVLGWSEAKARNLVYRGMKDLRDELRRMGIDCEMD
jgi:RNA polymerase sigma factor (sigma-70 family)